MKAGNSEVKLKRKQNYARKLVQVLLAITGGFLFIATFSNFSIFDESLDPEILEKFNLNVMPAEKENAYFAIWGLESAKGKNIIESGVAIESYYSSKLSNGFSKNTSDSKYVKIMGGILLDTDWSEKIDYCTSRKELKCTNKLSEQLINKPIMTQRLKLMLSRYQELTNMSEFQSSNEKNMVSRLPPYGNLMKLRRINLAKIFQMEDADDFILALKKDMQFWRMLLEKGDSLIDKMIAIASLWGDIQALSSYISKHPDITDIELSKFLNLLTPLTPNQLDIGNSFLYEQSAFINTLKTIDPESLEMAFGLNAKPMFFLIQPNATINDYYQYFTKPVIELAKLSAPDFRNKISETVNGEKICCFKEMDNLANPYISNFYNLGGKLLLSATYFQAHGYISRVHDLNGMFSLARLKLELVSSENLKNIIENSKEKQPYNLQPMDYDSNKNTISFECLNKGALCKIAL
ncbi:MAG: hypothetical protein COA86_08850 [Kangiella sp.]|nr:MAG: hypothetical protein COA86_08850 [Kangiella sp.]